MGLHYRYGPNGRTPVRREEEKYEGLSFVTNYSKMGWIGGLEEDIESSLPLLHDAIVIKEAYDINNKALPESIAIYIEKSMNTDKTAHDKLHDYLDGMD